MTTDADDLAPLNDEKPTEADSAPVPSPRQTQRYLRDLLMRHRLEPKAKLGQNYLIDLNHIDLILRSAELTQDDLVLEVGTGTGSLTARLADEAGGVLSVEIDADFHKLAATIVGPRTNVVLFGGDILRRKNEIAPEVLATFDRLATQWSLPRRKLVANLPYVVATPVIGNLLIGSVPLERLVVMVQWEIAERMTAAVGTGTYSSLAVLIQSLTDVEIIRKIPPSSFWPRPKVDSAIVRLRPNAAKRARIDDPVAYRAFLRDLYTHRRKNLRQSLAGWPTGRLPKEAIDAFLSRHGFDGTCRAETLGLDQHRVLYQAFRTTFPDSIAPHNATGEPDEAEKPEPPEAEQNG